MTHQQFQAGGPDLYAVLGIGSDATAGQVARAFRARVRQVHPDTAPEDRVGGSDLQAVLAAWRVLHDPERRAAYDRARTPAGPLSPAQPVPTPAAADTPTRMIRLGPASTAVGPGIAIRIAAPCWTESHRPGTDS